MKHYSFLLLLLFSLASFLGAQELTKEQKNYLKKASDQVEQAEKATSTTTLEMKLKSAKSQLDHLKSVASHSDVQKIVARYDAQEKRLQYEKEAVQLKSALGKAQSLLKRFPDPRKLPGYEKKNVEKYLKQLQESMAILRNEPEGQYANMLKQAEEAENGLKNMLEPAQETGPAPLSSLVQNRLDKISNDLTSMEQLISDAEKKLQSGAMPANIENVKYELQTMSMGLDAFVRQIELTKADKNHPKVTPILKRIEELKPRILTLSESLEKNASDLAQKEADQKKQKEAHSQMWIDNLKIYTDFRGKTGEKCPQMYSWPVYSESKLQYDPQKFQDSLKLNLQYYKDARTLFAEYQRVEFPQGKSSELEGWERSLKEQLDDFSKQYAKSLGERYQNESQKLEEKLAHLKKTIQEAEKEPAKKPHAYPIYEILPHHDTLRLLKIIAQVVKEVAPELNPGFPEQVDSLFARLAELEALNLKNLKMRAARTIMESEKYQGKDRDSLAKRAEELLFEHWQRCAYKPKDSKILKINLFFKDWAYQEQWVDGKYRIWREMKALIAHRPEGEPLWIWGGKIGGYDTSNSGEFQGIRLDGDYVYLSCIYLVQDKVGGEWRSTEGNYIWTDPMSSANLKE